MHPHLLRCIHVKFAGSYGKNQGSNCAPQGYRPCLNSEMQLWMESRERGFLSQLFAPQGLNYVFIVSLSYHDWVQRMVYD